MLIQTTSGLPHDASPSERDGSLPSGEASTDRSICRPDILDSIRLECSESVVKIASGLGRSDSINRTANKHFHTFNTPGIYLLLLPFHFF